MAFCSNCGGKIEDGVKFCGKCGNAVEGIKIEPAIPTCLKCGKEIENGVKFCPGCGSAVSGIKEESVAPQQQSTIVQSQSIMADEKYCFSCGCVIKKAAETCPKCGVDQNERNSITAIDVYCTSCGKAIKKIAEICPHCGVRQKGGSGKRNKTMAIVLLLFTACGHRFYTGHIGTAIIMILAYVFGLIFCSASEIDEVFAIPGLILVFGWLIWWIIDLVSICTGKFKDKDGNPLKKK